MRIKGASLRTKTFIFYICLDLSSVSNSSAAASMMGKRENSTLALNRLINMNHTPEQMAAISAIPPKAAKLMGDEIFSPISTGMLLF